MTSLFVPIDEQGWVPFFSRGPGRLGHTEIICDLESFVGILCGNALWSRDTILEVR